MDLTGNHRNGMQKYYAGERDANISPFVQNSRQQTTSTAQAASSQVGLIFQICQLQDLESCIDYL